MGVQLSPDDFDALIDYVRLFKQQFERRAGAASVESKGNKKQDSTARLGGQPRKSVDSASGVLD
jgi:hypothetical protein